MLVLLLTAASPATAADCEPVTAYTVTELEGIGNIFHITRAVALSPDGSAAGSSLNDSLVSHPVRWDALGQVTVLSAANGEAGGISSNGVVAGWQVAAAASRR